MTDSVSFLSVNQYIKAATEAARTLKLASSPGTFLVDAIPIREHSHFATSRCALHASDDDVVKYLPSWFPFTRFKQRANEWRSKLFIGITLPFDRLKADLVSPIR